MTITIASGKGGTGKTTLSTSLAFYLSSTTGYSVTLADLDVEEPNCGLFIQGEKIGEKDIIKQIPYWSQEKCIFCDRCQEVCNFNAIARLPENILVFPELCHSCYACVELCSGDALLMNPLQSGIITSLQVENLHFVEGKINVGEQQAVPAIKETKKYASQLNSNSILLLDAPPGTSCPVIESTRDADYVILVTEPTPFGLHDLKLSVSAMRKLGKKFGVVINRYGIGNKDVETFCEEEHINILGKIRDSRVIAEKYSRGEPIWKIPEVKSELKQIIKKTERFVNPQ